MTAWTPERQLSLNSNGLWFSSCTAFPQMPCWETTMMTVERGYSHRQILNLFCSTLSEYVFKIPLRAWQLFLKMSMGIRKRGNPSCVFLHRVESFVSFLSFFIFHRKRRFLVAQRPQRFLSIWHKMFCAVAAQRGVPQLTRLNLHILCWLQSAQSVPNWITGPAF